MRLGISRPIRPTYRSIVAVDISGSERWSDLTQVSARTALDHMVRMAFRAAGVAWYRLSVINRNGGTVVLVPASVSKVDLFDPVLTRLADLVHEHNNGTGPRLRLRVALHAGEVIASRGGWVGSDLTTACRLVEGAAPHQELLRRPDTDLVLVVSDPIHQAVVRHGHRGVTPSEYMPVPVRTKDVEQRAWLRRQAADRIGAAVS